MIRLRWLITAAMTLSILLFLVLLGRPIEVPPGATLTVDIAGTYVEAPEADGLLASLGIGDKALLPLLSELRKAERDERLSHVILRIADLDIGWAKAWEIREAITALSAAGRHPVAHLEINNFGSNLAYYIASAAEEIYLRPGSGPPLLGLAQEHFFLGGLWEKIGVDMESFQAGRYKSAVEGLTGRGMSDAYREQAEALLDAFDRRFVAEIAAARGIETGAVRRALDSAPSDPERLKEFGLIEGVATRAELLEQLGADHVVEARDYGSVPAEDVGFTIRSTLALIYASGVIEPGRSDGGQQPSLGADDAIDALETAAEDDTVSAIILRVDSPGGAAGASERIWHAVRRARESKPVVASFSDYAASGAYYMASAADAVVANPGTLTGSIGVFAVRPSAGDLLERLGIQTETLRLSPHASLLFLSQPLPAETRNWLDDDIQAIYRLFLQRVAEGRKMELAAVERAAEGRVWTGEEAAEHKLVDAVGGLREAYRRAKELAGLDPEGDAQLFIYPAPKPFLEQLRGALRSQLQASSQADLPAGVTPERWRRLASWFRAATAPGPALIAPLWIEVR